MSKADKIHFDDYGPQTRVKHKILAGYLPAYLTALKFRSQRLIYVDGFAGRGWYQQGEMEMPGSPMLALELVTQLGELQSKVDMAFVESRGDFFGDLKKRVASFCDGHPGFPKPTLHQGRSGDFLRASPLLETTNPTFLFLDPCGVEGVEMEMMARVLSQPLCELFLFFNSNGIERIAAAARARDARSPTLEAFMGSEEESRALIDALASSPKDPDRMVLAAFASALRRRTAIQYLLPLRVEFSDREDTSHYLLHACDGCLGFKIMKHVMLDAISGGTQQDSRLEFSRSSREPTSSLFGVLPSSAETEAWASMTKHAQPVGQLVRSLVCRPTDFNTEGQYKRALCELERKGKVAVFEDGRCAQLKPAVERLRMNPRTGIKEPTLANRLWIRKV